MRRVWLAVALCGLVGGATIARAGDVTGSAAGVPTALSPVAPAIPDAAGGGARGFLDGVLDACDALRDRFGDERLIEVLAAHSTEPIAEMLAAVERTLLDFCGGDLDDDVSMLALRVLPQPLS